jgi:basic amino acid/polyamine antiporter, APA family
MADEHQTPSGDGDGHRGRHHHASRIGSPVLFVVIYATLASAIYFSLGVIAQHSLGLTPVVFGVAGLLFFLAAMTYAEGASMRQERSGASVFARYAFNEVISFAVGWALLLDYVILIAVTALVSTDYLAAYWGPLGHGVTEIVLAVVLIAALVYRQIRGLRVGRARRVLYLMAADIVLQVALILVGLVVFFNWDVLTAPIELGSMPTWSEAVFGLGVAMVVFTGLESASGLAGEVNVSRRGLKRLVSSSTLSVMVVYVGIAVVALTAVPVVNGKTELGSTYLEAPVLGITRSFATGWVADATTYVVAAFATLTLLAAADSAMLGLSRQAYTMATTRQIPSRLGRLHPTRSTPYVVIALAGIAAAALVIPQNLDFLTGIYAFGSLLALTVAHASIVVLRYRDPDRARPFRIPWSVPFRGAALPIPALIGFASSLAVFASIFILHDGARYVGSAWVLFGMVGYVIYRKTQGKPINTHVTVPEVALRFERREVREDEGEFGSILVPIFGSPLDDDIVQTAGRLSSDAYEEDFDREGATIEAVWILEVPMSLPIDAALPPEQLKRARSALARAKAIGEEYEDVVVATATVRARRVGEAICDEARRRGVEVIVMAAEESSRIRGGALLGGRGRPGETAIGEVTKYVMAKAPCPVILTAPARDVPVKRSSRADPEPPADEPDPT